MVRRLADGAVGLNGAADMVRDSQDRAGVAALGWAKWSPVNAAAIGAHRIGGGALLYANNDRAQHQGGVKANTITKIAEADGQYVEGATEPAHSTSEDVTAAERQLQYLQWGLPALTGAIVILGAQQGEQQRPAQILTALRSALARRVRK